MKRRTSANAPRSAEGYSAAWDDVNALAVALLGKHDPRLPAFIHDELGKRGTDPVACLQARVWLRRGRPRNYPPAVELGWVR